MPVTNQELFEEEIPEAQPPHVRARHSSKVTTTFPIFWLASGGCFGAAVAVVLFRSPLLLIASVCVFALLSLLCGGMSRLLYACVLVFAFIAFLFVTSAFVFQREVWPLIWLWPCGLLAVIAAARFLPWRELGSTYERLRAQIEVAGSVGTLFLAAILSARVGALGPSGAIRFLLPAVDNAGELNTVWHLPDFHSAAALSPFAQNPYGPVETTYLGFLREAVTGMGVAGLSSNAMAQIVVASHLLMIVLSPSLAAFALVRTLRHERVVPALVGWLIASSILVTQQVLLSSKGFVDGNLATFFILVAALSFPRSRTASATGELRQSIVFGLLVFAAAASWVALVPLGILALVVMSALLISSRATNAKPSLLSAILALNGLMAIDLWRQYRDFIRVFGSAIGGGEALFSQVGGTPGSSQLEEAMVVALLLLVGFLWRQSHEQDSLKSLYVIALWLAGYAIVVTVGEAWTAGTPQYGSTKLTLILLGVVMALLVIEILERTDFSARANEMIAGFAIAVLAGATFAQGPIYLAVASHWPTPGPVPTGVSPTPSISYAPPNWLTAAERLAPTGDGVLCINTLVGPPANPANLVIDASYCNRWASSFSGTDYSASEAWRSALLASMSVSRAVKIVKKSEPKPIAVIALGSAKGLYSWREWWSGLIRIPGTRVVLVPEKLAQ